MKIPPEIILLLRYRRLKILEVDVESDSSDMYILQSFRTMQKSILFCVISAKLTKELVLDEFTRAAKFKSRYKEKNFDSHIFLCAQKWSPPAACVLRQVSSLQSPTPMRTELLHWNEIVVDKLAHINVPHYEILDEKQIKYLEKKRKLQVKNLPKMLTTDPIAKYLGLSPGDVISGRESNCLRFIILPSEQPQRQLMKKRD